MNLEISELSIVFIGELNPAIVQPSWLALKGLIQESEGSNAKIEIIHNEVSKFMFDWADIEITRKKFIIRTNKSTHFNIIKDLASSIFSVLKETPLKKMGINYGFHYQADKDEYIEIGNQLAPFKNWAFLNEPRLTDIEMQEMPRRDGLPGYFRVRVQPSLLIPKQGVFLLFNDHFDSDESINSRDILDLMDSNWENSYKRAKSISETIWQGLKA